MNKDKEMETIINKLIEVDDKMAVLIKELRESLTELINKDK